MREIVRFGLKLFFWIENLETLLSLLNRLSLSCLLGKVVRVFQIRNAGLSRSYLLPDINVSASRRNHDAMYRAITFSPQVHSISNKIPFNPSYPGLVTTISRREIAITLLYFYGSFNFLGIESITS